MDFGRILLSVKNVLKCININNIQFCKIYISQNTKMFDMDFCLVSTSKDNLYLKQSFEYYS